MGKHPLNLFARLILEIAALVTTGIWGYAQAEGWPGILLAIVLPIVFAAWALVDLEFTSIAWIFTSLLVIHYVISYDRIIWLIRTH